MDTQKALDSFLAHVEKRAYKMAHIATSDPEEALDIVQDAMLVLVKRYAHRSTEEWGPLFTRIMQNKIRDWYRREKVRSRWRSWFGKGDEDEQSIEQLPDIHQPDTIQQMANSAMTKQIEKALHTLPIRQQQVFLLRAWEGLNVKETATAIGISDGSVKTHYSRAISKLREHLKDFNHE